ncbi:hypothetical protein AWB74_01334 [Caballeronia arvi]|uniref:Uncharacterized protein n=1 Tax=Caballeronia arvi TaxID=1777135 RepID=A0A158GG12_9BURK|nr:hypothetical protein AWB74_01334 [Caballeronia arvi]
MLLSDEELARLQFVAPFLRSEARSALEAEAGYEVTKAGRACEPGGGSAVRIHPASGDFGNASCARRKRSRLLERCMRMAARAASGSRRSIAS